MESIHTVTDFKELYEQYLWEMYQRKVVRHVWGFYSYSLFDNYVFVADVFVAPGLRGQGFCHDVLRQIEELAESEGKDFLGTKVTTMDKTWENNLEICEHLGFRRVKTTSEYIFLWKER